ncbi:MAG: hypothetical protein IJ723_05115 [Ruminococcus sp.]|nr:hypothetical protein [Ruminococcus sp.]
MRGAPDVSVEDMIKQFKYFLEQLVSAEWRRGLVNHYGVSIMDQIEKKLTYGAREWYILQLMIKADYHDELGVLFDLLEEKIKDNSL